MYLLRYLRARRLCRVLLEQQNFYEKPWMPDAIQDWQLEQFNQQWQLIRNAVPYFEHVQKEKSLPVRFSRWQEFTELMPILDRKTVQIHRETLMSRTRGPDLWRATGGSTAQPLQIPSWDSEREFAIKDQWYGRSWFGVAPSDKLFLVWGHSHLLGSGVRGWINGTNRRLKDSLLGYYRYSAYDLSEGGLRGAAEALLAFRPAYVIGYAAALDRFARINQSYKKEIHRLGLKVAIATAESFPRPGSAALIGEVLGCPVVMEYGAVETGPIAHQRPSGEYMVFWRHYLLEARESEHFPDAYEVLVTSLYPRCLPLVRYRVGDLICGRTGNGNFAQQFVTVVGRCNDLVVLADGGLVHSEAFSHSVKDLSAILDFEVVQSAGGEITLNYMAQRPLVTRETEEIRRRLNKINPALARIQITRVDSLGQTIAGKTQRIRREA